MEVENRLSPNRLDSQVHAHMSRNLRAIEQNITLRLSHCFGTFHRQQTNISSFEYL